MKISPAFFLATLLTVFVIQTNYFQTIVFGDNYKWISRAENLAHDVFTPPVHIDLKDNQGQFRYGAHPGTLFILPAALAIKLGADSATSLTLTIAFLTALFIATTVVICHSLHPHNLWWLAAGIILTIHPLYFYSTPTNAVIAPLITLLFILTARIHEDRRHSSSFTHFVFAIVLGLGMATRTPITVFIAAPLLAFIYPYVKLRRFIFIVLGSLVIAYLFNPFLWLIPLEFMKTIVLRTSSHLVFTGAPGFHLTPTIFLLYTPLTFISLLLAGFISINPNRRPPLDIKFLLVLFLISGFAAALFIGAQFQSLRYLFPIIYIWDILLPLFLLHLTNYFHLSFVTSLHRRTLALKVIEIFIVAIVTLSFGYLFAYNILLPGAQGLI